MTKELVIAICLGAILGVGITLGLNRYQAFTRNQNQLPTPTLASQDITALITPIQNHVQHQLAITSPDNSIVVDSDTIIIKGTTTPLSQIVISLATDTLFEEADSDGNFSQEIELDAGSNIIQISSFSPTEEEASTTLLITYSTADF